MKTAVMPKGVEHLGGKPNDEGDDGVKTAVMPKGVEHPFTKTIPLGGSGENSSDAERR